MRDITNSSKEQFCYPIIALHLYTFLEFAIYLSLEKTLLSLCFKYQLTLKSILYNEKNYFYIINRTIRFVCLC